MKDLKDLANKYDSLTDIKKVNIEESAHGKVTSKWFSRRPEAINNLIGCSWFNLYELGLDIGEDGRLRLKEAVVSEIPEGETEAKLKAASDIIADYFSTATEYIENPSKAALGQTTDTSSEDWGLEEFLVGFIKGGRSG